MSWCLAATRRQAATIREVAQELSVFDAPSLMLFQWIQRLPPIIYPFFSPLGGLHTHAAGCNNDRTTHAGTEQDGEARATSRSDHLRREHAHDLYCCHPLPKLYGWAARLPGNTLPQATHYVTRQSEDPMSDSRVPPELSTPQLEPLQVDVVEAARLLGYSRSTIYQMLDTGELPSTRRNSSRRIPLAALQAWVESHTQQRNDRN